MANVTIDDLTLKTAEAADELEIQETAGGSSKKIVLQDILPSGKSGGQTVAGGTAAAEDLTLQSTTHATKGNIRTSGDELVVDENAGRVGFGTDDPQKGIHIQAGLTSNLPTLQGTTKFLVENTHNSTSALGVSFLCGASQKTRVNFGTENDERESADFVADSEDTLTNGNASFTIKVNKVVTLRGVEGAGTDRYVGMVVPDAEPTVDDLGGDQDKIDTQAIFYLDETNDQLMVKVRYSDQTTVKKGVVASLT